MRPDPVHRTRPGPHSFASGKFLDRARDAAGKAGAVLLTSNARVLIAVGHNRGASPGGTIEPTDEPWGKAVRRTRASHT